MRERFDFSSPWSLHPPRWSVLSVEMSPRLVGIVPLMVLNVRLKNSSARTGCAPVPNCGIVPVMKLFATS